MSKHQSHLQVAPWRSHNPLRLMVKYERPGDQQPIHWLDLSSELLLRLQQSYRWEQKLFHKWLRNVHHYDTGHKDHLRTLKSNNNKGLLTSHNSFLKDWNILWQDLKTLPRFKKALFNFFCKSSSNVF